MTLYLQTIRSTLALGGFMSGQQPNSSAGPRKSRATNWGAAGAFIAIAAIAGWRLLDVQETKPGQPEFIPTCDSPVVREAVQDAIERNAASNIATLRLLDMQNVHELKANPTQRLCGASLVLNNGVTPAQFIVSLATTGDTLVLLGDELDIETQGASNEPAEAPIVGAPATTALIPATELADLFDPPNPATVDAVVARARELCSIEGTEERVVTFHELREMAGGMVAAFDAAGRRGFQRTAQDETCYRDALELLREYNFDGSRLGEEELDSEPAPGAQH